ncbi:MAG: hypothetical protein ACTH7L_14475 [Psychrobacter alimentarius]
MNTSTRIKKVGENTITWKPLNELDNDFNNVRASWRSNSFNFREEDIHTGSQGLRPPQIGAIHAGLGYEKSDHNESATIVMPTGTGKTETIL